MSSNKEDKEAKRLKLMVLGLKLGVGFIASYLWMKIMFL